LRAREAVPLFERVVSFGEPNVLTLKSHEDEQQVFDNDGFLGVKGEFMEGFRLQGLRRGGGERRYRDAAGEGRGRVR
jgi:hypothetical protein